MPSGEIKPYLWGSRMIATINTIHRRTHVQAYDLLHRMAANGEIEGFLLPYMGQIDERLPYCPPDLVPRDRTFNYPTNFSPMSDENIRVDRKSTRLNSINNEHLVCSLLIEKNKKQIK